jgi:hypothetical protein
MKKKSLFLLLVLTTLAAWFATSQVVWADQRTVELRTPQCV